MKVEGVCMAWAETLAQAVAFLQHQGWVVRCAFT
jgi:hypothetical protein